MKYFGIVFTDCFDDRVLTVTVFSFDRTSGRSFLYLLYFSHI